MQGFSSGSASLKRKEVQEVNKVSKEALNDVYNNVLKKSFNDAYNNVLKDVYSATMLRQKFEMMLTTINVMNKLLNDVLNDVYKDV